MSPWRLRQIARQVNQGAIIAYPTDTIWGFGCNPGSANAITKLQNLKQRSPNKGLILLAPQLEYLQNFIDESTFESLFTHDLQPTERPITWIIKASKNCPIGLTGKLTTIAVRICNIQPVKLLCDSMQSALVSTSANISGFNTARNSLQVHQRFQNDVDFIIEGFTTGANNASEIRDLETGKILRS